jgi:hypothetical protein
MPINPSLGFFNFVSVTHALLGLRQSAKLLELIE